MPSSRDYDGPHCEITKWKLDDTYALAEAGGIDMVGVFCNSPGITKLYNTVLDDYSNGTPSP